MRARLAPLASSAAAVARALPSYAALWASLLVRLVGLLGGGGVWLARAAALVAYAALLLPGFAQVAHFYFTSPRVARSVRYGRRPRNALDLYFPPGVDAPAATAAAVAAVAAAAAGRRRRRAPPSPDAPPIVVYVTGGAWIIGHRAWGALLGRRLSARGAVVACVDYRNFPQAAAPGMVADVSDAVGWVAAAAGALGGGRVHVVGQSAGAHVACLALLAAAAAEDGVRLPYDERDGVAGGRAVSSVSSDDGCCDGDGAPRPPSLDATVGADPAGPPPLPWRASRDVASFVGVSGVYDVARLAPHFAARGLRPALQARMFAVGGSPAAAAVSPTVVLASAAAAGAAWPARLPRVLALHGTRDACAPAGDAARFVEAAVAAGVPAATLRLYDGDTHTSPLIENPMRGGGADALTADVCGAVGAAADAVGPEPGLCPGPLIWAAARVCPF